MTRERFLIPTERGLGLAPHYLVSEARVTTIGRESNKTPKPDIQIPSEFTQVSRPHVELRQKGDKYILKSLSGNNPTRIIRFDEDDPLGPSKTIDLKEDEEEVLVLGDIIDISYVVKFRFTDQSEFDTHKAVQQVKLKVVLNADAKGYSELVDKNTELTDQRMILDCYERIFKREYNNYVENVLDRYIERSGDGIQALFSCATNAVLYARAVQDALMELNSRLRPSEQMIFRIGCASGDIRVKDGCKPGEIVCGRAVNLAQRIQEKAEPGGVLIARNVYEELDRPVPCEFKRAGIVRCAEQTVEVYQLIRSPTTQASAPGTRFRIVK